MRCLTHWSGQQQHLLQWLQALGAQEMQWAQVLEKEPWLQMYTVPGNCTPLGWQTTDGSPGRTWQAWGGSFLLLPRRHALSSRWLWTFNHNTCEKRLEEVQGSATSPLFTPPLHVHSSCVRNAMIHASETWPLTKPNLQRLKRNDRAMIRLICNFRPQDIVTTRSNELLVRLGIEDLDLILKERRLRWYGHVERSNGAVKTAFDIQVDGKCGPGRPKMTWKQLTERDCREWKLSAINPLDVPGDLVWDLPWVQQASYLERGPLMWMLPLYLHVNQKSDYDYIIYLKCKFSSPASIRSSVARWCMSRWLSILWSSERPSTLCINTSNFIFWFIFQALETVTWSLAKASM